MINVDGSNNLPESIKHNRERLKRTAEKKIPKKNQPVLFAAKKDPKFDALDKFAPLAKPLLKASWSIFNLTAPFAKVNLIKTAPFVDMLSDKLKKAQEE